MTEGVYAIDTVKAIVSIVSYGNVTVHPLRLP